MAKGWLYPWAIGAIAFGGASLIVPLYVVQLGGTAFTLGVLAAVAAFVGVPGALIVGRLADRTGKRRTYLLAVMALETITLAAIPLSTDITLVIVANGVLWFVFAAAMPVLNLLAVTDVPAVKWSERIGILNKYQGIGWAVGLFAGAVWTGVADQVVDPATSVRWFFFTLAAIAAVATVAGHRVLPPDPGVPREISELRLRRALRKSERFSVRTVTFPFTVERADFRGLDPRLFVQKFTPTLAWYYLAVVLFFVGFSAFFAPLPAFLTEVGFTSDAIFGLYLVSSIGSAAFFELAGRWAGEGDPSLVQVYGLTARGIAIPFVAILGGLFGATMLGFGVITAVFALIGLTWAIISVTAGTLVTQLTPSAIRGEALGFYAALGAFAGGVGSIIGGATAANSYLLAYLVSGGLVLLGAGVVFLQRDRSGRLHVPSLG